MPDNFEPVLILLTIYVAGFIITPFVWNAVVVPLLGYTECDLGPNSNGDWAMPVLWPLCFAVAIGHIILKLPFNVTKRLANAGLLLGERLADAASKLGNGK